MAAYRRQTIIFARRKRDLALSGVLVSGGVFGVTTPTRGGILFPSVNVTSWRGGNVAAMTTMRGVLARQPLNGIWRLLAAAMLRPQSQPSVTAAAAVAVAMAAWQCA